MAAYHIQISNEIKDLDIATQEKSVNIFWNTLVLSHLTNWIMPVTTLLIECNATRIGYEYLLQSLGQFLCQTLHITEKI